MLNFGYIIMYVFFGLIASVVIIGLLLWIFIKKTKKVYAFLYRNPINPEKPSYHEATIKTNDAGKKQFYLKDFDQLIDIKSPTTVIKDNPYYEITRNKTGHLVYIDKCKINNDKDIEFGIEPEDVEIAISKYRKFARRYDVVLNKSQTALLMSLILLTVIVIAGMIATIVLTYNGVEKMSEVAKAISPLTANLAQASDANLRTTEALARIYVSAGYNGTRIRPIS